jgi:hopanoid biosynthesis associated radical SAM protein HpnH
MPVPISVNVKVVTHLARARLRARATGRSRVPIVLMLELTYACNLRCAGCGRIREHSATNADRLAVGRALAAVAEADTPVVSISGGEPLLHPDAPAIAAECLAQRKLVYLCTNGLLLAKRLSEFAPHPHLFFNVHLDGPPAVHDQIVGLPGASERALDGIRQARATGFGVTTNTTIYRDTRVDDVVALFRTLHDIGVAGFMLAPGFDYEVGISAGTLSRAEAQAWFRDLRASWRRDGLYHTPLYMEFLSGERDLDCMPWGTVTFGPQGWRRPCYLLADAHVATVAELLDDTDWQRYGPGRDPRCANCMLHSGFEPSVMGSMRGPRDWWRVIRWQAGK